MSSEQAPEPDDLDREQRIIELRRTGATWRQVADQMGYAGPSGAYQAYQRIANRFIRPKLEELRDIELDRLDRLQLGIWAKAASGDIKAIDSVLRIIEKRAKLLGLDSAQKIELDAKVETHDRDSIDAEVARLVALLEGGASSEMDTSASQTGADTNRG
jgi:hypothetical protein